MNTAAVILLSYFVGGLLVLIVFDLATKRVRNNVRSGGFQAQMRMAEANSPIGVKAGIVMILALTWLFWPMVLVGAVTDKGGAEQEIKICKREPTLRYLVKKIWYGECPSCHVILVPDTWDRASCPVCHARFGTIIRRSKNGPQRQGTDSENTGRGRRVNIIQSKTDSKQPDRPSDLEAS